MVYSVGLIREFAWRGQATSAIQLHLKPETWARPLPRRRNYTGIYSRAPSVIAS